MFFDLEKLRVFYAVAKYGGVTAAAAHLGVSQPAVSRQVSTLEAQLKIGLFYRHPRGFVLTEQGEKLWESVRSVFSRLMMTDAILSEHGEPQGILRIACPSDFASSWLPYHMGKFLTAYPNIRVSLMLLEDRQLVDLALREVDISIQPMLPTAPDFISHELITHSWGLFASPKYLEEKGVPVALSDLDEHRLIAYNRSHEDAILGNTLLTKGTKEPRRPFLVLNGSFAVRRAIAEGIGIGMLHDYNGHTASPYKLTRLLPKEIQPAEMVKWFLVYPEPLQHSKRIQAFSQYLQAQICKSS